MGREGKGGKGEGLKIRWRMIVKQRYAEKL
jgi:hypothetical protein